MLSEKELPLGLTKATNGNSLFTVATAEYIGDYYGNNNIYLCVVDISTAEIVHEKSFEIYDKHKFIYCEVDSIIVIEIYPLDDYSIYHKFGIKAPSLNIAAKIGNLNLVKKLVNEGENINHAALQLACIYNHYDVVDFLVQNGAPIDQLAESFALQCCIKKNHCRIIKLLLEIGVVTPVHKNIFDLACVNGHLDIVRLLIEYGFDINQIDDDTLYDIIVHRADYNLLKFLVENGLHIEGDDVIIAETFARKGDLQMVKFVIEKGLDIELAKNSIFDIAVMYQYLDIIKYAVELGANLHTNGKRALASSCMNGNHEIRRYLIHQGVRIDTTDLKPFLNCLWHGDIQAVEYFLQMGFSLHILNDDIEYSRYKIQNIDTVKYLAKNGIDLHSHNDFDFLKAVSYGNLDVIKFLVEDGADIHVGDDAAFIIAVENKNIIIVKYLWSKGANIHGQKDYALSAAANSGRLDVVKFLVEKGMDINNIRKNVLETVAMCGYLDMVKYLVENGITNGIEDAIKRSKDKGHIDVTTFLEQYLEKLNR